MADPDRLPAKDVDAPWPDDIPPDRRKAGSRRTLLVTLLAVGGGVVIHGLALVHPAWDDAAKAVNRLPAVRRGAEAGPS